MTLPRELAAMQQWMLATIADPATIDAAVVCNRVTAGPQQSPAQRLSVYQHAYFARLLDVLREQFPCTRFAAGDEAFDELATDYIVRQPPSSYTLARLADGLPRHLEATRPRDGEWGLFLVELTQLEQAIDRIFDGPGPERLPPFALPGDAGEDLRLRFVPGCELHSFRFPVSTYYSAWKAGGDPNWPQQTEQHVALLRRDYIVRRCELSPVQAALLSALHGGATLGEAVAAAAGNPQSPVLEQLAPQLHDWFAHWSAAGLFTS